MIVSDGWTSPHKISVVTLKLGWLRKPSHTHTHVTNVFRAHAFSTNSAVSGAFGPMLSSVSPPGGLKPQHHPDRQTTLAGLRHRSGLANDGQYCSDVSRIGLQRKIRCNRASRTRPRPSAVPPLSRWFPSPQSATTCGFWPSPLVRTAGPKDNSFGNRSNRTSSTPDSLRWLSRRKQCPGPEPRKLSSGSPRLFPLGSKDRRTK